MRFRVVQAGTSRPYWWIKDTDSQQYGLPERACSLNFDNLNDAEMLCEQLNKQWARFSESPW